MPIDDNPPDRLETPTKFATVWSIRNCLARIQEAMNEREPNDIDQDNIGKNQVTAWSGDLSELEAMAEDETEIKNGHNENQKINVMPNQDSEPDSNNVQLIKPITSFNWADEVEESAPLTHAGSQTNLPPIPVKPPASKVTNKSANPVRSQEGHPHNDWGPHRTLGPDGDHSVTAGTRNESLVNNTVEKNRTIRTIQNLQMTNSEKIYLKPTKMIRKKKTLKNSQYQAEAGNFH